MRHSTPETGKSSTTSTRIFKDEIRGEIAGNVYGAMGNRFQLDGKAYNHLFSALNAVDRLRAIAATPPFGGKDASLQRQRDAARAAFAGVLENLSWPRYQARLEGDRVDLAGPSSLRAYAGIPQYALVTVTNGTALVARVRVSADGLSLPAADLELAPGARRHLLAALERENTGRSSFKLAVAGAAEPVSREVAVETLATGVLAGSLVEADRSKTSARVRVTDINGGYRPPESHRYGLILKMHGPQHNQIAHRWFYADGEFRVRAPAGRIKVAIRKGLEYRNLELDVDIPAGGVVRKSIVLERWINMPARGWRAADVHLHYFDPPTVRFEMAAEDVAIVNVLVMNDRGAITARQYFTGALDPISDDRHLVYYNEEFRNGALGHLVLMKLKQVVEPISTGRLGTAQPQFFRVAHYNLLDQNPSRIGSPESPDRLLVEAMRETHRQGGLVNWAHLRGELEFPLDAALGELDTVDILTDTKMPDTLISWYHLLNCGFRLPATAGTDRADPHIPIGHQRTYTRLEGSLNYDGWIETIRRGASFVTNAPMVELTVDGVGPGSELEATTQRALKVRAEANSQIPFERLEIILNGRVVRSVPASSEGRSARLVFDLPVKGPAWIAARAMGSFHPEIMYYGHPEWAHPVVGHTNPVWVRSGGERLAVRESAEFLLDWVRKLEAWARDEAYFGDDTRRQEALTTIRRGIDFLPQSCPPVTQSDDLGVRKLACALSCGSLLPRGFETPLVQFSP